MANLRMKQSDMDDIHEDLTNIYLKYYDRYKGAFNTEVERRATVAVSMVDVVEDINHTLMTETLNSLIRKLTPDED